MSVANGVLADGNIKGSGCKPETDEMTDVDVKARFQTGTTGNSSNQILKISDSDIARGVFYVFVNLSNWGVLEVSSDQRSSAQDSLRSNERASSSVECRAV